jgi:hypothetical protein
LTRFKPADIERALADDSDFAAAWALAADLRASASFVEPERAEEHLLQSEWTARRALDLDRELGSAQGALGMVLVTKKDWSDGRRRIPRRLG